MASPVTDMMQRIARKAAGRAVHKYGLPRHYHDDLVNVTLLAQWLAVPKRGAATGTDGGYFKVVATRAARDFARWVTRRTGREQPYSGGDQEPWRHDPEPAELPAAVTNAVGRLSPGRRVVIDRYLAGAAFGGATAKQRLKRALRELRAELGVTFAGRS